MNREQIIRMAREAGFRASVGKTDKEGVYHPDVNALSKDVPVEWVERFAALVAAAEREECARVCCEKAGTSGYDTSTGIYLSEDIRARGQQ